MERLGNYLGIGIVILTIAFCQFCNISNGSQNINAVHVEVTGTIN